MKTNAYMRGSVACGRAAAPAASRQSPRILVFTGLLLVLSACGSQQEEAQARRIPLDSVYSTNGQKGLKTLSMGVVVEKDGTRKHIEPYGRFLTELYLRVATGGPNVFLVRGKDITEAVKGTWEAFTRNHTLDRPVAPEDVSAEAPAWLVVYFGSTGSDPPAWLVQSIDQTGNTIRLTFLQPKRARVTKDDHRYFFWAPLGPLGAGSYALELFDADKHEVRLMRRISIPNSKK